MENKQIRDKLKNIVSEDKNDNPEELREKIDNLNNAELSSLFDKMESLPHGTKITEIRKLEHQIYFGYSGGHFFSNK